MQAYNRLCHNTFDFWGHLGKLTVSSCGLLQCESYARVARAPLEVQALVQNQTVTLKELSAATVVSENKA